MTVPVARDAGPVPESVPEPVAVPSVLDLFDRHADGVYTLAHRLLGDRHLAEDVTQETFIAAMRNLGTYRGEGPVGGWLYRIAYRQAVAQLRRRRDLPADPATVADLADRATPPGASPEARLLARELAAELDAAIASLSPPLRAAFVLRDVQGLSTAEVAIALGIGESAVKMRLARARDALRAALKGYV